MLLLAFRKLRESARREQLLATIARCHGITKAELCRLTGLSWGTVSHHVRQLRRLGALRFQPTERRIYLYTTAVHSEQMTLMRLMRDETTQRILEHVRAHPGAGIQDLSRALDVSRKTIRRYMADLVDARLLDRTPDYRPKFHLVPRTLVGVGVDLHIEPPPSAPQPSGPHPSPPPMPVPRPSEETPAPLVQER